MNDFVYKVYMKDFFFRRIGLLDGKKEEFQVTNFSFANVNFIYLFWKNVHYL